MGQVVGGLWDTVQGKRYVKRTCDKVFDELADKRQRKLPLTKLHLATLMVYSAVNKQYLSPYKEPPTIKMVEDKIKQLSPTPIKSTDADAPSTEIKRQLSPVHAVAAEPSTEIERVPAAPAPVVVADVADVLPMPKIADADVPSTKIEPSISNEQFYEIILEWLKKDLRIVLANKVLLALLGAPALSMMTKSAAKSVPRINHVVEKVPTPVLIPAYAAGIVLLQDVRLE
ncbi:NAD(P)-binding domain-containing protein [Dioscorea alata]|uniref:NAD(P)-binding domain-containing protein n=1 Tax=Dioscorea alata TaxID=55571 RepID=A0ACB7WHD1_DIOAL|nr:NAD(P)-binding domain-containing protein [Dioscorea alata]